MRQLFRILEDEEIESKLDLCSMCQEEVEEGHEALQCDICERWEHCLCIKVYHRPTTECYNVLCASPTKALVFMCSRYEP